MRLLFWIVVAAVVIALVWPTSAAGRAVVSVANGLAATLRSGDGTAVGG